MSKLTSEQAADLQTLFAFEKMLQKRESKENECWTLAELAEFAQDVPSPTKLLHSLMAVKIMAETGVLDPKGNSIEVMCNIMLFVKNNPAIREMASSYSNYSHEA